MTCGARSGTFSSFSVLLLQSRCSSAISRGADTRFGRSRHGGLRLLAALGHLGCVLAVVIVIVLLSPATATAQIQGAAANESSCKVEPNPVQRAWSSRTFIAHRKPSDTRIGGPTNSVTLILGARQKTAEPTSLKEFLDFAADAGGEWRALEKTNWKAVVGKLSDAMKALNLRIPNIDLVKTSGEKNRRRWLHTKKRDHAFRSQ